MMGCTVLLLSSVVSTLGGLVFGYELGIISGALLQLQAEFRLSCAEQEAVVSALLVGALLASLVGGCLIDRHGRRNSILLGNVLILAGSLVLLSSSYLALVVGRMTVGFAMCISSMSCCILVSEMVTPKRRGLLVTLYEAGITVGILAAYAVNYVLSDITGGWKYMFGLAIVPTLVQFISIWFLPSNSGESSSRRECVQTERGLLSLIESQEVDVEPERSSQRLEKNTQYNITHLFHRKDNMRTRTAIGLGLVIFQQFTGQPNVLFYASTIFHSVGFRSNATAVLASVGLGVVKVVATLVSMVFADRVGRRPLLISGCSVMAVCSATIGLLGGHLALDAEKPCGSELLIGNATSLSHVTLGNRSLFDLSLDESHRLLDQTEVGELQFGTFRPTALAPPPALAPPTALAMPPTLATPTALAPPPNVHGGVGNWIVLICMMGVVSAYSVGFGPMTWLVLSEIFPAGVRGRAFAFANCFNWAAHLIVTFSFLNVIDMIGLSGTFLMYGLIGVIAVIFFYLMLPETKGKSLEEINKDLCRNRVRGSEDCCSIFSRRGGVSPGYQRVHIVNSTS